MHNAQKKLVFCEIDEELMCFDKGGKQESSFSFPHFAFHMWCTFRLSESDLRLYILHCNIL